VLRKVGQREDQEPATQGQGRHRREAPADHVEREPQLLRVPAREHQEGGDGRDVDEVGGRITATEVAPQDARRRGVPELRDRRQGETDERGEARDRAEGEWRPRRGRQGVLFRYTGRAQVYSSSMGKRCAVPVPTCNPRMSM
jgi:hypothetical protein